MSSDATRPMTLVTSKEDRRAALEAAFDAHHSFVLHLALRYGGGSRAWAEDVTQDVFVTLCARFDDLDATGDLRGWLYRVVTNRCLSRLRRESVWARITRLLPRRADSMTPEEWMGADEELRRAWAIVQELPPKERVVLCMVLLDGKKQSEVAQLLGYSEGFVSKLLARARRRVREHGWELQDG